MHLPIVVFVPQLVLEQLNPRIRTVQLPLQSLLVVGQRLSLHHFRIQLAVHIRNMLTHLLLIRLLHLHCFTQGHYDLRLVCFSRKEDIVLNDALIICPSALFVGVEI